MTDQNTFEHDRDLLARAIDVATDNFNAESGRVVVDEAIRDIFYHLKTMEQFRVEIENLLPKLGKKDLVIRVYSGYERNLRTMGITIEWRPKTLEEKIRDVLREEFTSYDPQDDIPDALRRIMELIHAERG